MLTVIVIENRKKDEQRERERDEQVGVRVCVCVGVLVCVVWHAEKPPCVETKGLRVCRQTPVSNMTRAFCRHTETF